jgi:hypothetical protein
MLSFLAKVEVITGAANGILKVKPTAPEAAELKPALPDLTAVT